MGKLNNKMIKIKIKRRQIQLIKTQKVMLKINLMQNKENQIRWINLNRIRMLLKVKTLINSMIKVSQKFHNNLIKAL